MHDAFRCDATQTPGQGGLGFTGDILEGYALGVEQKLGMSIRR